MDESFHFMQRCPKCGDEQLQDTYTYAELWTQLEMGDAIVAYCAACDEVWPVGRQARARIARQVDAEDYRSPLRPRAVSPGAPGGARHARGHRGH